MVVGAATSTITLLDANLRAKPSSADELQEEMGLTPKRRSLSEVLRCGRGDRDVPHETLFLSHLLGLHLGLTHGVLERLTKLNGL